MSKIKSEQTKSKGKGTEYANANTYRHFLAVPATGHSYIQWAFGLRSHSTAQLTKTIPAPPQTFHKTIKTQKEKHTSAEFPQKTNISQFEHLTLHRKGNFGSSGLLKFQTTLRYDGSSKELKTKEKKWCSLPKKDRRELPTFIKSQSLRKSVLNPEDFEVSSHAKENGKFTEKIIKQRNMNGIKHMIKPNLNLPSIAWQANLRSW